MTADRLGIRGIPALLFFRGGQVVDRLTGVQARDVIEQRLAALL